MNEIPYKGITLRFPTLHTDTQNGRSASNATKPDESADLKDIKNKDRPKSSGRDSGELRIAGIDCNPGPDAQDRLRRLFTLLIECAVVDRRLDSPLCSDIELMIWGTRHESRRF